MSYTLQAKLSDQERHTLITEHRNRAFAMALSQVRRWGAPLSRDEVRSIADLAVCEAARGFRPEAGTFETYLFYYVRKELLKTIDRAVHHTSRLRSLEQTTGERESESSVEHRPAECQEQSYYRKQLRGRCAAALAALNDLERRIISGTIFDEEQVTEVARKLGYSRGHLSEVKRGAMEKLRVTLREAA
jgi:RNA polymerase sigma factor (sigma-70 family)